MKASPGRDHWQRVYSEKDPSQVSWFDPALARSLALIEEAGVERDAAILDAGGGASRLAGHLIDRGYSDVTVADISPAALDRARAELGERASEVEWVEADLREADLGPRFDLWHDRAVLHFMVDPADRTQYLSTLRGSLRPGAHVVVATFGPEGPTHCSGLPTARYGADELAAALGDGFEVCSSAIEQHTTPAGNEQQFLYARLRYSPAGSSTANPADRQA